MATLGDQARGPDTAEDLSRQLVEAVISDFPDHEAGTRPVHTIGIGATGYFVGSDVAPSYSAAEQFRGHRVPVTVRFSNGSGSPVEHDGAHDARGMATKFHLADDRAADLIMMTLPLFFVRTPKEFLRFARAGVPRALPRQPWWRRLLDKVELRSAAPSSDPADPDSGGGAGVLAYADRHRYARPAVLAMGSMVTPTSYARVEYHAVHAFKATNADGVVRYVRFTWEPVAGVRPIKGGAPLAPDYLHAELAQRLRREPARFVLRMQVGGPGDRIDDPTTPWSNSRPRVVMGELVLTSLADDQLADCERLSFNPSRVVSGLECSDDPVLAARRGAYEWSCQMRGGSGCPVGRSPG